MVTEVRSDRAIDEFATNVGEWLLTQRFGSITPVAFRWYLHEPYPDDDELPHVVIELTVEDPPPPPDDLYLRSQEEQVKLLLWPEEDMCAAEERSQEHIARLEAPPGLRGYWPARVVLLERSGVEDNGSRPAND